MNGSFSDDGWFAAPKTISPISQKFRIYEIINNYNFWKTSPENSCYQPYAHFETIVFIRCAPALR